MKVLIRLINRLINPIVSYSYTRALDTLVISYRNGKVEKFYGAGSSWYTENKIKCDEYTTKLCTKLWFKTLKK